MSPFSHVAIIFNPNSTGDAPENAKQLAQELKESNPNLRVELLPTQRAGHAIEMAYAFATEHPRPLIVSASGDGGYNEVINGAIRAQLKGAEPTCAVLPSGNANDHARTMQDRPLAQLIKEGVVTELDVLKLQAASTRSGTVAEERYAHSYIGLGLTPTVAVELNKHTLNSFKEGWIVVKTFWGLRPVRIMTDSGARKLDSLICSVIPEMAKLLTISEKAKPRDGLFELTTFEHNRKIQLLYRLARGVFKSLGAQRRLSTFTFTVLSPVPIQLDGEVMELKAGTKVTVSICPGLLKTLADV